MRRHFIRLVVPLLAVAALAVGCGSGDDMDPKSYKAGYDVFGRSYMPASDESREAVEARCDDLYPTAIRGRNDYLDIVRADWVQGCADGFEGKDPRYG